MGESAHFGGFSWSEVALAVEIPKLEPAIEMGAVEVEGKMSAGDIA